MKMDLPNTKLPLRSAIFWILLATLIISGTATIGLIYYRYIKKQRFQQVQYNIVAIVQTTPDKERLKTIYLTELLNLSVDRPTNLFRFNAKEAHKTLMASPLITSARVKKILPGTVYIDYTLRKPLAYLLDYTNAVVDKEGIVFPFNPFFTPKKLPEILLGMTDQQSLAWGKPLGGIKCKLALYLIDLVSENCCTEYSFLTRVDVSQVLADSYGQRQIVISVEDHIVKLIDNENTKKVIIPQLLRLSVDHYRQELANYLLLRMLLHEQALNVITEKSENVIRNSPVIIDLRIPELAYIKGKAEG